MNNKPPIIFSVCSEPFDKFRVVSRPWYLNAGNINTRHVSNGFLTKSILTCYCFS